MNQDEWAKTVEWVGVVAGCVIKKDSKYLLVQENEAKVRGLWNLPAGYVDKGETIEQGAIREAKEESGFDVRILSEIGVYHEAIGKPVKHAFEAEITGGELARQEGEIQDVRWFTFQEIQALHKDGKIRADWIYDSINVVEVRTAN